MSFFASKKRHKKESRKRPKGGTRAERVQQINKKRDVKNGNAGLLQRVFLFILYLTTY